LQLYEVAPLPWQARNVADIAAAIEAFLRVVLMVALGIAVIHSMRAGYNTFLKVLLPCRRVAGT
jgi:hypothetical protein